MQRESRVRANLTHGLTRGLWGMNSNQRPTLPREGVPAVDIIDLTPFTSYHHTAGDTLNKCSPESLEVVGRVVMVTLAALEREGWLLGF
jgi:hypothetical protein